jgi:hypothetical protein
VAGAARRLLPALLPAIVVVAMAFASGGFLPGPVALGATALALALLVRVTTAANPWGALSGPYVAGAIALGLLAGWTLLSATWSDAPARALTEYDRVLLYLLGFLVVGAAGRSPQALRWAVRGLAGAAFVICLCALVTRLAPDVWPIDPGVSANRLSYPLGYWNALGLLAAIGIVLSFALTSDDRERPAVRVLAAAALPVLAPTLLLTFSRGAIAAGAVGMLALLLAGRPRALLGGLLAGAPAATVAVVAAYGADLLATTDPTSAAATAQGHDVALVVGACVLAAAALRALLLPVDRRIAALPLPPQLRRREVRFAAAGAVALAGLLAALALGAPGAAERQFDRFAHGERLGSEPADQRSRLTEVSNNGRVDEWRVALDAYERESLRGMGAGTYALEWDRDRPTGNSVEDAHSLYAEVLGELGIVGFLLVAAVILLVLGGFAALARGPDRVVGGALLGAGTAWALHAGIDWDWEMPAITFWFFAAGGLALAAPVGAAAGARAAPPLGRVLVALGCLALALVPARVFLSEGPLRDSARAFARGDCATAIDRALDATSALGVRPEPFVLLGYCDVRVRQPDLALRAFGNAVRKDPRNWEGHYGLALVRAAAGRDPRPALLDAQRLNPREPLITRAQRLFATDDPRAWRRRALTARLPVD